jgi:hypothetical protein
VCFTILAVLAGCRSMNRTQSQKALPAKTKVAKTSRPADERGRDNRRVAAGPSADDSLAELQTDVAASDLPASAAEILQTAGTGQPLPPPRGGITNHDIVNMTRSNVPDEVIINAIQSHGGKFDTSPEAIILLYENQVSERVIRQMQQGDQS